MSVNIKQLDGTLKKVAGSTILLDGTCSEIQSGTITIPANTTEGSWSTTVTMPTAMTDTDYIVILNVLPVDGTLYTSNVNYRYKTTTSFIVHCVTGNVPLAQTIEWYAFRLVELEGYNTIYNKMTNIDTEPTENSTNLVTSGGVYDAIKNASSVFIGTSSEWESETSKTDYQVAILTDKPNVNAVDSTTGDIEVVANKHLVFKGTLEEWEALTTAEKKTYDEALITNDMDTGEVVDAVTNGDMRAVTSNAVYDAIAPIGTVVEDTDHTNVTLVEGAADQTIRTLNLTTGTWIIRANVGWAMATSAQTVSISITPTTNTYNAGCYQGLDSSRFANQSCCITDIVTVTTASKNFYLTAWAAGAAEIVEHPYFSAVRII